MKKRTLILITMLGAGCKAQPAPAGVGVEAEPQEQLLLEAPLPEWMPKEVTIELQTCKRGVHAYYRDCLGCFKGEQKCNWNYEINYREERCQWVRTKQLVSCEEEVRALLSSPGL